MESSRQHPRIWVIDGDLESSQSHGVVIKNDYVSNRWAVIIGLHVLL